MRSLLLAGSALALLTLAACDRHDADETAATSPAPPAVPAPRPSPKPVTKASAVTGDDAGAYGMPRAPIPYDELDDYERRQLQILRTAAPGQGPPPAAAPAEPAKPPSPNTVFY